MGTISFQHYGRSSKACLLDELASISDKILKISQVGNIFYLAVKTESGVVAHVAITSKRDGEFSVKYVCETTEPFYYDCPKSILKLLSEPLNDNARNWREKCLLKKNKLVFSKGDILEIGNNKYTVINKICNSYIIMNESKVRYKISMKLLKKELEIRKVRDAIS